MSAVTAERTARGDVSQRPGLGRLTRVELRKMLDTRAGMWLQIATVALTLLAVIVLVAAGDAQDHRLNDMLSVAAMPSAILLPVMGILLVTSEYTQRTTLVTFALVPQRGRVLLAKLLAGIVLSLAALVVCIVLAVIGTAAAGADVDRVWSLSVGSVGETAVMLVTGMVMGIAFGAALLTSAPAIVLYFALPTVFGILGEISALRDIAEWLDTSRTMGEMGGDNLLSGTEWARVFVSLLLWMALPLTIGWWRVTRGEVR